MAQATSFKVSLVPIQKGSVSAVDQMQIPLGPFMSHVVYMNTMLTNLQVRLLRSFRQRCGRRAKPMGREFDDGRY